MSFNLLIEALENAGDGAFVTDKNLTVTYWNRAAEDLLAQPRVRVEGRPCYLILRGVDDQDNLLCHKNCRMARKAIQGSPVENFDLRVRSRQGRSQWINVSLFTFPSGGDGSIIVHLIRDASQKLRNERLIDQLTSLAGKWQREEPARDRTEKSPQLGETSLTERESEVLLLLARGGTTTDIAETLSISDNTARNHIQNILKKLGVHSRLEAVVYANRHGLVDEL